MGNFDEAVRAMREATLRCPRCGADNHPGAKHQIELNEQGLAFCSACCHVWDVHVKEEKPS